ncbi:AAA family ATPase [Treponema sp. HNW]|uniref:ATP-binding protein n=1 Tax=Treponema sp. HNW TaxID=3116654 RepID=UPI003D11546A
MLYRKIETYIRDFFVREKKKALLITGARQVGKTYIIEKYGAENYQSFVKINFVENIAARDIFIGASDSKELLLRISAVADSPLMPGKTLIFFDEVQECKEIVTAIKFLVDEGSYRYILSGSLLGVDLKDIRSIPVGYMDVMEMFPLSLEEFAIANSVSPAVIDSLRTAFKTKTEVDEIVHAKMMELFHLYLIVGGMPEAVNKYLETNNLFEVLQIQRSIVSLYKKDIAKYDPDNKLYLEDIFDLIPSELNAKNKRFIMKNLNEYFKFSRYKNSFIWLKDAGVALPVFCVAEPKNPLLLSKSTNLFKLFLSDIGLLASMYGNGIQLKILKRDSDINFGAIYENAAAQELKAQGFMLYYFNGKKTGELDFVIESDGKVIPIEIKSGKKYKSHSALNNVLANESFGIENAYVFHGKNVESKGKITYYPIYMLMFVQKNDLPADTVYKIDLKLLQ